MSISLCIASACIGDLLHHQHYHLKPPKNTNKQSTQSRKGAIIVIQAMKSTAEAAVTALSHQK